MAWSVSIGRKRVAWKVLELRILVTRKCLERDLRRVDDLLRRMTQLYKKYCFVFVVGREMEDEWWACLEGKKGLEIRWSIEVSLKVPGSVWIR
jgi:hypothetical protein